MVSNTPPKTNMEPKNEGLEDVSPFPRGYFQVPCLFSGVYFLFSSLFGEMMPFDEHIFQMGGKKPPTSKNQGRIVFRGKVQWFEFSSALLLPGEILAEFYQRTKQMGFIDPL